MSGFQIPGLGFAKPDEKLPPLPADQALDVLDTQSQPETSTDVDITDAPAHPAEPNGEQNRQPETAGTEITTVETINSIEDSMAVDQSESPPDLTGALEAALGGLENPNDEVPDILEAEQALGELPPQPENVAQDVQGPEFEMDSSPYVSSSESSSDSSDEDSDDAEGYELLGVEETARLLMEAEAGSEDEGDKGGKAGGGAQLRTKNELPEEVIPRPDVTITTEMKIDELGVVEHIVENMLLIKAFTPGEYQVLDTGSIICNADRVVLGVVADLIGKVLQPMYTVRFNSHDEIKELDIEVGTKIYYPIDHANFVFTEPLKNLKGSDASNLHDEEIGDDEMEFSDDEKEAEYKRSLKQKKNKKGGGRAAGGREPHPLSQEIGELNYDDEDGPYKPLARPPGFGSGSVSQETDSGRPSFRGRGRGDTRGRGSRGRGGRGGRGGTREGHSPTLKDAQSYYSQPQQGSQYSQQSPPSQAPFQTHPQYSAQPPPPPGWNSQTAAAVPNFGFQWPPAPQGPTGGNQVPPPPPGWPGAGAQGQGQAPSQGAFVNPAFFAALMSHMQGQQQQQNPNQGNQQWGGQHQPPPGGYQ